MLLAIPVAEASSSAARPLGRPQHRHVAVVVGVGEDAQRGGLARAGRACDAHHSVGQHPGLVDEHPLLAAELAARRHQHPSERRAVRARRVDVEPIEREVERLAFNVEQLVGREPCRPSWRLARLDKLDHRTPR